MKRTFIILAALAFCLAVVGSANATFWTHMSGANGATPLVPDGAFSKVQAIDQNTFTAVGTRMDQLIDMSGKQVFLSSDGGTNVNTVFTAGDLASGLICKSYLLINDAHFTDANNGLVFGTWAGAYTGCGILSTYHNYIANTADGGATWNVIAMTPDVSDATMYGVGYFDANTAFATGHFDDFWGTTTGGGAWTQLGAAPETYSGIEFHSVSAPTANNVYAAGEVYPAWADDDWAGGEADADWGQKSFPDVNGTAGQLVYTNNAGLSWNNLLTTADLPAPLTDMVGFHKVQFIGANGWLLAANADQQILDIMYSTDSGTTWNSGTLPSVGGIGDPGDGYMIADLTMLNAQVGWAVGYSYSDESVILSTSDGGQNWQADDYTGYGPLLAVSFIDGRHGFATGKRLTVLQFVNTVNNPPIANAGNDQQVPVGQIVDLDGTLSYDPDGDPIVSYNWTQTAGASVTLNDATTAAPNFSPNVAGIYKFQLVVNDGTLDSIPDEVLITVGGGGDDDAGDDTIPGDDSIGDDSGGINPGDDDASSGDDDSSKSGCCG